MKKRIMCAVIASAMIAASAMSAVAYADDTAASASESSAKITRGVYAAYEDKDGDGKFDDLGDYYIFEDETAGHTSAPGKGIGLPFAAEQNGTESVFHFGGVEDTTKAEIKALDGGDFEVTFTYESGDTKTYKFVFLAGADPETFSGEDDNYADEDAVQVIITKGVYAAYGEGQDTIADYYIFDDETQGHTAKPDTGLGLPFSIEQNGDGTGVIHFASADNNTPVTVKAVDTGIFDVTFTTEDDNSYTYRFELLPYEDPDTFEVETEGLLTEGVYAGYISSEKNDVFDQLGTYFVFDSASEGHTSAPLLGIGIPFSVEQNGVEAVFHFASADDNSPASIIPLGDSDFLVTISYDDETSTTYRFIKIEGADAATFDGAKAYYGTFEETDDGLQLYNANGIFGELIGSPMADETGLEINYAMPLLDGLDISFTFTTSDNNSKTYNISYEGEIDNDTVIVDLGELLSAAGVDGKNVVSFTVHNNDGGTICALGFVTESSALKLNINDESAVDAAVDSGNPATGADDIFAAGARAAFAGAAALRSRKRK